MAFRRRVTTIEEVDDSPGLAGPTVLPEPLRMPAIGELKSQELTRLPSERDATETVAPDNARPAPRAPQRTNADLFAEFRDDARIIATSLTILAFVIFASRIQTVRDVAVPIVVSVIFNGVWFGLPWLKNIVGKWGDT